MSTVCWVILQVLLWPPGSRTPRPRGRQRFRDPSPSVTRSACASQRPRKPRGVDPILAVSVGWEESGLTEGLTSSKGARARWG